MRVDQFRFGGEELLALVVLVKPHIGTAQNSRRDPVFELFLCREAIGEELFDCVARVVVVR